MKRMITSLTLTGLILWAAAQEFPRLTVDMRDLDGKRISSNKLLQPGSPTLVTYWNPESEKHQNSLSLLYEAWNAGLRAAGIRMVVICTGFSGDYHRIKPIVKGNSWEFETFIDVNGEFLQAMGIGTEPCTILYDAAQHFLGRFDGEIQGSPELIAESLMIMLGLPIPEQYPWAERPGRNQSSNDTWKQVP